ncbi:MAG: response regulator [bacterium]|nr:response regulator [bacterium]
MAEKKTILVVEDEESIAKSYLKHFHDLGWEVVIAIDGEDALEKLKNVTPDLILLDLILPKMHGFEFLSQIKQDEKLKNLPVIILSNLSSSRNKDKAVALGAEKYFVKTEVTIGDIVEMVQEHFR